MNTIEFTFNYYTNQIILPIFYLNNTKMGIKEIILEEVLKQGIMLNLNNIYIYDIGNNKMIETKDDIITSNTKKYKILIKPVVCNCDEVMISKY